MKSKIHFLLVGLLMCLGFLGCRTSDTLTGGQSPHSDSTDIDSAEVKYTAIYIIHGDANYLYHDQEGKPLQADEEKVKEARSVARRARQGEVFIFHQRPEKKILGLFPKKDRTLWHYRNGELIQREKYSPASSDHSLMAESELVKKYQSGDNTRRFFLYFGHEIPHMNETGYHKSRPNAEFDIEKFAAGMRSFLSEGSKFELTVLSTCDNGTPVVASKIKPLSRYLLASPQNLHLSHIDSYPLLILEQSPQVSAFSLADSLAQQTYDRLDNFIETAITLSIYNLVEIDYFLALLSDKYLQYHDEKSGITLDQDNTDCATLPFWDSNEVVSDDVKIFYRPSNFGAYKSRKSHSGWGCQK